MSRIDDHGLLISSESWHVYQQGGEWQDIRSGDDWLLGYLPYQDEPPRCVAVSTNPDLGIDQASDSPRLSEALRGLPITPWRKEDR